MKKTNTNTTPIKTKIRAYGGESITTMINSRMAESDYLEITIPGQAFRDGISRTLLAEAVIDHLHLPQEHYDRAKEIEAELDGEDLDEHEFEDRYYELDELNLRPEDLGDIEVYGEMENYPALCEMIQRAANALSHRLIKAIYIPLSEVRGIDITIEPAAPYDEVSDDDLPQSIEGVRVTATDVF